MMLLLCSRKGWDTLAINEKACKVKGLNRKHYIAISAFILIAATAIIFFIGFYSGDEIGEYEGTLVYNSVYTCERPGEADG